MPLKKLNPNAKIIDITGDSRYITEEKLEILIFQFFTNHLR